MIDVAVDEEIVLGLSYTNTNANQNTIEYAWYIPASGNAEIRESGSTISTHGLPNDGDVFKIERDGSSIKYYKNTTLVRTITEYGSGDLLIDLAMNKPGTQIQDLVLYDENADYAYYTADQMSYSDYYAFGMQMPGRQSNTGLYDYGFNGMRKDDEISGDGNSYDFGARMYNSRLGRWFSVDPLADKYSSLSPYNFANNSPLYFIDPDGQKIFVYGEENQKKFMEFLSNIGLDGHFRFAKNGRLRMKWFKGKGSLETQNQKEIYAKLKKKALAPFHVTRVNIVCGPYIVVTSMYEEATGRMATKNYDENDDGITDHTWAESPEHLQKEPHVINASKEGGNAKVKEGKRYREIGMKPKYGKYKVGDDRQDYKHDGGKLFFFKTIYDVVIDENWDIEYDAEGGGKTEENSTASLIHLLLDDSKSDTPYKYENLAREDLGLKSILGSEQYQNSIGTEVKGEHYINIFHLKNAVNEAGIKTNNKNPGQSKCNCKPKF